MSFFSKNKQSLLVNTGVTENIYRFWQQETRGSRSRTTVRTGLSSSLMEAAALEKICCEA